MSSLESAHRACELGECQAWIPDPIRSLVRGTCERGEWSRGDHPGRVGPLHAKEGRRDEYP